MSGADWTVLEIEGVERVVQQVAAKLHRKYPNTVERADCEQEARLILATKPDEARAYVEAGNLGGLNHWLACDLDNLVKTDADHRSQIDSRDRILEERDSARVARCAPPSTAGGGYRHEVVERLLPTLWDRSYAYGMSAWLAPDPDMPKARTDPSHGNGLWAELADIRNAWKRAPLTTAERRAILLRHGFHYDSTGIAGVEHVAISTASRRIDSGIDKLAAWLNGERSAGKEEVEKIAA